MPTLIAFSLNGTSSCARLHQAAGLLDPTEVITLIWAAWRAAGVGLDLVQVTCHFLRDDGLSPAKQREVLDLAAAVVAH